MGIQGLKIALSGMGMGACAHRLNALPRELLGVSGPSSLVHVLVDVQQHLYRSKTEVGTGLTPLAFYRYVMRRAHEPLRTALRAHAGATVILTLACDHGAAPSPCHALKARTRSLRAVTHERSFSRARVRAAAGASAAAEAGGSVAVASLHTDSVSPAPAAADATAAGAGADEEEEVVGLTPYVGATHLSDEGIHFRDRSPERVFVPERLRATRPSTPYPSGTDMMMAYLGDKLARDIRETGEYGLRNFFDPSLRGSVILLTDLDAVQVSGAGTDLLRRRSAASALHEARLSDSSPRFASMAVRQELERVEGSTLSGAEAGSDAPAVAWQDVSGTFPAEADHGIALYAIDVSRASPAPDVTVVHTPDTDMLMTLTTCAPFAKPIFWMDAWRSGREEQFRAWDVNGIARRLRDSGWTPNLFACACILAGCDFFDRRSVAPGTGAPSVFTAIHARAAQLQSAVSARGSDVERLRSLLNVLRGPPVPGAAVEAAAGTFRQVLAYMLAPLRYARHSATQRIGSGGACGPG